MQNISWNPVRRCGGIVVRGYARETDFFYGCLRAAFVSIANLRKTFDACKFFFMFFAWLSRRRIFTAGRVSVRRRHAIYRADGGLEKNSKSRAWFFLNAAFADAVSYPKKVDTVFFMVCLLLQGNDYLFSAGVYVFRTCVYGSRKTRVYIFKFNRQMCLLISGKDNAPYNPYKWQLVLVKTNTDKGTVQLYYIYNITYFSRRRMSEPNCHL